MAHNWLILHWHWHRSSKETDMVNAAYVPCLFRMTAGAASLKAMGGDSVFGDFADDKGRPLSRAVGDSVASAAGLLGRMGGLMPGQHHRCEALCWLCCTPAEHQVTPSPLSVQEGILV